MKAEEDLLCYYQDYDPPRVLGRRFMFAVLGTIRKKERAQLVKKVRDKRSVKQESDANKLIEIIPEARDQIMSILHRRVSL